MELALLEWYPKLKSSFATKLKMFVLDEAQVMIAAQSHQDESTNSGRVLFRNFQT